MNEFQRTQSLEFFQILLFICFVEFDEPKLHILTRNISAPMPPSKQNQIATYITCCHTRISLRFTNFMSCWTFASPLVTAFLSPMRCTVPQNLLEQSEQTGILGYLKKNITAAKTMYHIPSANTGAARCPYRSDEQPAGSDYHWHGAFASSANL